LVPNTPVLLKNRVWGLEDGLQMQAALANHEQQFVHGMNYKSNGKSRVMPRFWRALPVLLLALTQTQTGLGQITLSSFTVGDSATAGAHDSVIGYDLPPDQEIVWTTNAFSLLQTNEANSASVGVAGASALATNIGWVGPLSLTATGSVSVSAFSTTNRVDDASAAARA
jgi:hypothetical protein